MTSRPMIVTDFVSLYPATPEINFSHFRLSPDNCLLPIKTKRTYSFEPKTNDDELSKMQQTWKESASLSELQTPLFSQLEEFWKKIQKTRYRLFQYYGSQIFDYDDLLYILIRFFQLGKLELTFKKIFGFWTSLVIIPKEISIDTMALMEILHPVDLYVFGKRNLFKFEYKPRQTYVDEGFIRTSLSGFRVRFTTRTYVHHHDCANRLNNQ